ncbi:MAG: hypothetical protein ACTSYD_04205 [Candidatus Heimdallarchaeaceae archaeon]
MIEINNRKYRLCLFDTNALSSLLQKPKEWFNYFNNEFSVSGTIISCSIYTLSELYFRQELFEKYLDVFSSFPFAVLDGYEGLFTKEMKSYNTSNEINPIVIVTTSIQAEGMTQQQILSSVIQDSKLPKKAVEWKSAQKEILSGMIELKSKYLPKNEKYTEKEIDQFVFFVATRLIGIMNNEFASKILLSGKAIDIEKFPSIRCISYFVFYKFYPDNRKPTESDVFDIMISALLPYVDYFISEGNNCEIIKRIQSKHNFLCNVKPYKLKEISKILDDYT